MINVAKVLTSHRLCKSFTVYRNTGHFAIGGYEQDSEQEISMIGAVMPTDSKDIDQLPEGDRVTESFTFYSKDPIYLTSSDNHGTSDQILYNGTRYRVAKVRNFLDYGYNKAIAVRMNGD
jgi:hypothetical protein